MPLDPAHTYDRVRGHVLHAGVSENAPWIRFQGPEPQGVEADLIRGVAARMNATVEWRRGGETALMKDLEAHRLDIVAGGITSENPWTRQMGAARPYATVGGVKHMVLVPPGENRWLLVVDGYTHDHQAELRAKAAESA